MVAKPGKVSDPAAHELIAAAEMESESKIMARGRTYARAGQVVSLRVEPESFSARIQGTGAKPYEVRLDRTTISGADRVAANCTCPYGCEFGWCKHAAALAYVAAFLLDHDPVARSTWTGVADDVAALGSDGELDESGIPTQVAGAPLLPAAALMLGPEDLAALRSPSPSLDPIALLAAAEALVPHPWRPTNPDDGRIAADPSGPLR